VTRDEFPSERPAWFDHALCTGLTALFFPEEGHSQTAASAKVVCAVCPVRDACLELALVTAPKFGIWGGFSIKELNVLRRDRRAA
jgi:WhiB family redox-sensing transcriptional regulator